MLMLSSPYSSSAVRFHLVRHGVHSEFGQVLSGRAGAPRLTEAGRFQISRLAGWAGLEAVSVIQASPQVRTRETASILAAALQKDCTAVDALDEVDFGAWNGLTFGELEEDAGWRTWNSARWVAPTPGGETMAQAVRRMVDHMESTASTQCGQTILCVTHCDIIRGVIAHYLGLSLDNILRFDIDPGSVSTILLDEHGGRVTRINEVPA